VSRRIGEALGSAHVSIRSGSKDRDSGEIKKEKNEKRKERWSAVFNRGEKIKVQSVFRETHQKLFWSQGEVKT